MKRSTLVRLFVCVLFLLSLLIESMIFEEKEAEAALSATIYWTQSRQTIDGFGASGAFNQATTLMNYPDTVRTKILDLLFSQSSGAGLSIIRNQIGDGWAFPTIEPEPGVWDWSGDDGQVWLMNEAKNRGTNRFWSTVWSPPAWMKDNGQVPNGGSLSPAHYQDYANYLSTYVQEYSNRFGLNIYAVSLANEPTYTANYSSCLWTGQQFHDFILNNLKPTFRRDGVSTKVMITEDMFWREDLALPTLNDSNTSSRLDIVGGHDYNFSTSPLNVSKSKGKKIWQTEVSYFSANDTTITDGLRWAKEVHNFMTVVEANAWHYWWLVSDATDGESLIQLNTSNQTYTAAKRLFTIGNFSRFVRPGFVRMNATANPAANLYVSAYRSTSNGKFAVVVINDSDTSQTIKYNLNSFNTGSVTPYITSATQNLQKQSQINTVNNAFTATIPARSVVTYSGTAY